MALPIMIQQLQDSLSGVLGGTWILALVIMAFMLIGFMFTGIDFRFAAMIIAPMVIAFTEIGWFPGWVGYIFWFLVVVLGGYIAWNYIREK